MAKDHFYFSKLISKSLLGTLHQHEKEELDRWLTDPRNQAFYDRVRTKDVLLQKNKIYKKSDSKIIYQRLQGKMKKEEPRSGSWKQHGTIYKYVAAVVILFAIGYLGLLQFPQSEPKIELVQNLEPGIEKATLILSDGNTVLLDKGPEKMVHQSNTSHIVNDTEGLKYISGANKPVSEEELIYNTLLVPRGGIYKLELSDGTRVWLNSDSKLRFPEVFSSGTRVVELSGEAFFEVVKDERKFLVKTSTGEIEVLGTSFNVSAYEEDGFFSSTLVEGEIKLSQVSEGQQALVMQPGQRAVIASGANKPMEVMEVDPRLFSSWKDGMFYFKRVDLETILTKMGRWYDFEVHFEEEALKHKTFTGVLIKKHNVKRLLELISKSSGINYEISKQISKDAYDIKIYE